MNSLWSIRWSPPKKKIANYIIKVSAKNKREAKEKLHKEMTDGFYKFFEIYKMEDKDDNR
tara:strand:- start:299 stop:478 length:180 start_codon:yes stop_codon:yes gene_type:complete